jgi:hypothetical protein
VTGAMTGQGHGGMVRRIAVRLVVLAGALHAAAVGAAITDPRLAIEQAVAEAGSTSRLVSVAGSFPAEDLLQQPVPVQLLVFSGASYVRYDLSGGAFTGSDPALVDGLQAQDVPALLAAGVEEPTAEVALVVPGRVDVLLPAAFPAGGAVAQLFIVHEGDAILSNPFPIDVGELP